MTVTEFLKSVNISYSQGVPEIEPIFGATLYVVHQFAKKITRLLGLLTKAAMH